MTHGTRACYQSGCRALACRAANAAYEAQYRADKRAGKVRLGSLMSAAETWQRLRQLKPEFHTFGHIAVRLGYQTPPSRKLPSLRLQKEACTVRNMLRVRRLYRLLMTNGPHP